MSKNQIDFTTLANRVNVYPLRDNSLHVSEQDILNRANKMARRGFIHTPKTLQALESYLNGFGILFTGHVGVGKTFFFECLSDTQDEPILFLSMHECFLWEFADLREWLNGAKNYQILVDDIGSNSKSNQYGTKYEPLKYILEMRLRSPRRTHFTTNGTPQELESVYDAQVVDRLFEMAKPFTFDRATSMRTPRPNVHDVEREQRKISEMAHRDAINLERMADGLPPIM